VTGPRDEDGGPGDARAEAARRRRLAEAFGDVLPQTTSDERDPGESVRDDDTDEWLLGQVPPHHG
jgi:hypothetical protein